MLLCAWQNNKKRKIKEVYFKYKLIVKINLKKKLSIFSGFFFFFALQLRLKKSLNSMEIDCFANQVYLSPTSFKQNISSSDLGYCT